MKAQIETLVRLQQVETEIGQVQAALDEVADKIRIREEELQQQEEGFAKESESLEALKKQYRDMDRDLKSDQDSIQKSQARLNTIKTNKEYQALLRGIDDLKKKNSQMEDEMLGFLDQIEEAEKQIAASREYLEKERRKAAREIKEIRKGNTEGIAKLQELKTRKESVSVKVPPDLMEKFMTIRKRFGNPVIVPVRGIVCEGCNMNIPPQMRNELKRYESLKFCPFCNRIIYWVQSEKE